MAQAEGGATSGHRALYTHLYSSFLGYLKVTATSSIFPASTSWVAQSTITPNASGGSSSSSTSKSSSKTGAIVGCIVSLTLIAGLVMGLVARFVVRRRRACSPPSDTSDQGGKIEQPVPYPLTIEPPILYVSDYLFPLPQTKRRELQLIWLCVLPRTLQIQRRIRTKSTIQKEIGASNPLVTCRETTAACQRSVKVPASVS